MGLNKQQQEQLKKQLKAHQHKRYEVDIELSKGGILKNFVVHPRVLRPEKMSAFYLAKWLLENKNLYQDQIVIDMGSGSGIQGIVMGIYGAKKVIFSDFSLAAVANTKENVKKYNLQGIATIVQGDLFENIKGSAKIIVFNHPFFHDHTIEQLLVSTTMLDRGKLIHRFFEDAKDHLATNGIIIMPYFHLAGPVNDPAVQAPKHGYKATEKFRKEVKQGLQQGQVSVYQINL